MTLRLMSFIPRIIQLLSHKRDPTAAKCAPTFETRTDRSEGPPRLLLRPGHARHVVVDERGAVELQHLDVLADDVRRRAAQLIVLQVVVHLDDVGELVGDVVLAARRAEHDDGGPDAEGRHRHHRDYHPVGPRVHRVHAQDAALGVADALEDLEDELGRHVQLLVLRGVVRLLPLRRQLQALQAKELRFRCLFRDR